MDTGKDYYAILGVMPEAEPEIIRAVYLALAKKYHPDSSGDAGNEDRLKEINAAYEILNNPARRSEYDASRAEGNFDTGDYETDVDDTDLFADDIQDDWEFAIEYHPELASLLEEVASISPTLSIVFQSTILSNKAFNEAAKIKDQLISSFLQRYFGKSNRIQKFANILLLRKHMAAAKELNRAIKILGDEVEH
jgi:curved DNA-binding protein CbpA